MKSTSNAISHQQLIRKSSLVMFISMISRIMGFVRDMIVAQCFGVLSGLDAFIIASRFPQTIRMVFTEGSLAQALMPVLAQCQQNQSPEQVKKFIGHLAGTLTMVLTLVSIVVILCSPIIISVTAPGFHADPQRYALAVELLRVVFPYVVLISLSAVCGVVLNAYGYFSIPAMTSIVFNIVIISFILKFSGIFAKPIMAMAWGMLLAGVGQILFQLPQLMRAGLQFKLSIAWRDPYVKKVFNQLIPAIYALSATQLHFYLNSIFASFLIQGSISWLYFATLIAQFPSNIFAYSIATVLSPTLAQSASSPSKFNQSLDWGLKSICLLAVPCVLGLQLLAKPILTTLFQYGHFSASDVSMTAPAMIAIGYGLPAMMAVRVLCTACYAQGDYRTPVRAALMASFANIVLDLMLIFPYQHVGLALATCIAAYFQVGVLLYRSQRLRLFTLLPGWSKFFMRLILANIIMLICLYYAQIPWAQWLAWGAISRGWHLGLIILIAFASYLSILTALGERTLVKLT